MFHYFWKHPCSSHDPDSHGRSHIFFGGAVAAADPMVVASTRSSLEISLWSTSAWSMRNFTVLWRSLFSKCLPNKKQQKMKGNTGGKELDVEKSFAFISRYWTIISHFSGNIFGIRNQCPCNLLGHFGRVCFCHQLWSHLKSGPSAFGKLLGRELGEPIDLKVFKVVSFLHRWAIFCNQALRTKNSHVNLSEAESHVRSSSVSIKLVTTVYIQDPNICAFTSVYISILYKKIYTISLHVICIRVSFAIAFPPAQFLFLLSTSFPRAFNKKKVFF